VTRRLLDHSALLSTRNSPGVQARGLLAMFRWGAEAALEGRLRRRALVVGGGSDIVTKAEASRAIVSESNHASLEIIGGANHMAPYDMAERINAMIADFVLSVQRSASRDLHEGPEMRSWHPADQGSDAPAREPPHPGLLH
jgi:hypothetical protein